LLLIPVAATAQDTPFYPDDPYFFYNFSARPYFPGQWHLENNAPQLDPYIQVRDPADGSTGFCQVSNTGVDANLREAWNYGYTGSGVVIGVVDDGVEGSQPDIAPNYRADLSANFTESEIVTPQSPVELDDNHGTCVAGVAAARGGNGIGGTGAAPYAQIAGLRILDQNATSIDEISAYYWKSGVNSANGTIEAVAQIQVKNHSYGPDDPFDAYDADIDSALSRTAANGVIHVFAAGNERDTPAEDAAKNFVNNNPNIISVAALGSDEEFANYSSYGSCVFVTAPSNRSDFTGFGITTTDRTGTDLGYNRYSSSNSDGDQYENFPNTDYASLFGGTSSAAPLVSGIMALGKEANPNMDVRMAKHALVTTSQLVDEDDSSLTSFGGWRENGAGYYFNPNYGFGNIDAGEFVQKVHNVAYLTEDTEYQTGEINVNQAIPDNDENGISQFFTLTGAMLDQPLEGVEVYLSFTHGRRGDLQATISSPSGMASRFMNSIKDLEDEEDSYSGDWEWYFLSNAFWGEDGVGIWTLTMADMLDDKTGTWNSYNVWLNMGQMVLQTEGTMTQSADINADSLSLTSSSMIFVNPSARIFQVKGNVIVQAGELVVNGQVIEAPGSFGNRLSLSGGMISGTGQITASRGLYNSGGTVSPGNSIGTLTINGNYYQAADGRLLIEVTPTSSDRLVINGAASLDGTLQATWSGLSSPSMLGNSWTFLTASSGVSGTFSPYPAANITPTVVLEPKYDLSDQVYLVLERDYVNGTLLPYLTSRERAVGNMLNSVANPASGDLSTVLEAIDVLSTYSQAANALDQLAPKSGAAQSGLSLGASTVQAGNITGRLSDVRRNVRGFSVRGLELRNSEAVYNQYTRIASNSLDLSGMLLAGLDDRWGFFVTGNATSTDQRSTSEQMGFDFKSAGVTAGMDYRFSQNFIAGLMTGYNRSDAHLDDAGSAVEMESRVLGAYGTYYKQGFYLDGHLNYSWNSYDNTRRIVFPGVDRTAVSSPKGKQVTVYCGTGYDYTVEKWTMGPTLSLQYVNLTVDDYTESGADSLNLHVNTQTAESLQGSIGTAVSYKWDTKGATFIPSAWVSYKREFSNDGDVITAQLAQASTAFSDKTVAPEKDFAVIGASFSAIISQRTTLHVNYRFQMGRSDYRENTINVGLRMQF
jgi:outer membrane autotransporter protein